MKNDKVKAMLMSRRFWAAAAGLIVVVASDLFGIKLDETQVVAVAAIVVAWIGGDTFRETKLNG